MSSLHPFGGQSLPGQPLPGVVLGDFADDHQPSSGTEVNAADLVIGDVEVEHDADATEASAKEREYKPLPTGVHPLVVLGFGKATRDTKKVFIQGPGGQAVPHQFIAMTVTVRFGHAQDHHYQITDAFVLPPDNQPDLKAYNYGSTKPDWSTVGFHAEKFGHFINRLVGGFSKGQKLPPVARELKNWIGRQIEAEVVISKAREGDKVDPATGKKIVYPERPQVKLYSYRATGTVNATQQTQPQAFAQPQAQAAALPRGARNI